MIYIASYLLAFIVVMMAGEAASAPSTIPPANQFTLEILTDSYSSSDTAWTLYQTSSTPPTLIASKVIGYYNDNLLYTESYSLADGKYQFSLTDDYGDGLINPAYYTISLGSVVLWKGGGIKFSVDLTTFNVPLPPANQFALEILTDKYSATDNSWTLYQMSSSPPTLIASKAIGSFDNNMLYTESYSLTDGKYQFSLMDDYGDGLIKPAYYTISLGGVFLKKGGRFNSLDNTTFTVVTAPVAAPVLMPTVVAAPSKPALMPIIPAPVKPVTKPTKPAPAKPVLMPTKTAPVKPVLKPTKPAPAKPVLMPTKTAPVKPVSKPTIPAPVKPVSKPTIPAPVKPVLMPTKPAPKPDKPISPVGQQKLFDRYVVIVLENESYNNVMQNSYFNSLASKGTLFTSFFAITHPSYPNYIGMVAGSDFGITSDTQVNLNQKSIADLLEASNLSWKNYAEDYPGNCFLQSSNSNGTYARKHVPFLSFQNVQNNATRCKYVVPGYTFQDDWKSKKLPNYAFYTPNMKNDGHDTTVAYAASWLQTFLDPLLADSVGMEGTLIQITYDEDDFLGTNQIYNLLIGPMIKANQKISATYNHYNMLRSVEYNFNLGSLGQKDTTASIIKELWP